MEPFTGEPGLQRRLSFAATPEPIACSAYLTGLLVAIDADANRRSELAGVLEAVGIEADAHPHHGLLFPVSRLYRVANIPDSVEVDVDPELDVLWQLAVLYGSGRLDGPATLQVSAGRPLLRWEAGSGDADENLEGILTAEAAGALLHSRLPFIAASEAWELVARLTRMPLQAAVMREHRDGYIELRAMLPQQVESAPVPGLWRIDQTTYGAPSPYASRLSTVEGLRWEGQEPEPSPPITLPPAVLARLDGHVADGARNLAQRVQDHGSAVIAWPSGLGRRVAALAALDAVDSLPVQILCPAWAVWSWLASLTALGMDDRDQARIITWDAAGAGAVLHATPALIVDDFTGEEARGALGALRRLDSVEGVARIGVCSAWPSDLDVLLPAMRLIRPGEFPATAAGSLLRYPLWPSRRAYEHAEAYRIPPPPLVAGAPYRRRFDVRTVALSPEQRRHLGDVCDRSLGPDEGAAPGTVELLRELTSAGTPQALSAKVSQVAGQVRRLVESEQQVLVVARHERTLTLLRTLVRGGGQPRVRFATWSELESVQWSEERPDTVVVCDYPDHPSLMWQVAGVPGAAEGAAVLLWHTHRSVDDELAVSSSRGVAPSPVRLIAAAVAGLGGGEPETFDALG